MSVGFPLLLCIAQRQFSSPRAFESVYLFLPFFLIFKIFFYFAWLVLGFGVGFFVCFGFGVFCPWHTACTLSCAPVKSSK